MRNPQLWERKWKIFITESVAKVYRVSWQFADKLFNHFHLSERQLPGETVTFIPRIPRNPYIDSFGDVIEDNFTRRISVAPSIDLALKGLNITRGIGFHVYVADFKLKGGDGIKYVDIEPEECPENEDTPYGIDFLLRKWLKQKIKAGELEPQQIEHYEDNYGLETYKRQLSPRLLPSELKDDFEYCVPDADASNENWLLEDTQMLYLGEIKQDGFIDLSPGAVKFLESNGVDLSEWLITD